MSKVSGSQSLCAGRGLRLKNAGIAATKKGTWPRRVDSPRTFGERPSTRYSEPRRISSALVGARRRAIGSDRAVEDRDVRRLEQLRDRVVARRQMNGVEVAEVPARASSSRGHG